MSVSYKDKSPNALWYGLQHTKAFGKGFTDYGTKKESQSGAKNIGFMAGSLVGGGMVASLGVFAVVPLLPSFISLIAIYVAFHFGVKAVRNFANVKNSSSHHYYIQEQEQKWLENKSAPSLLQRLKNSFGKKTKADNQRPATPPPAKGPISNGDVFSLNQSNSEMSRKGWSFDFNDTAKDAPKEAPNGKPPANTNNAPAPKKRIWNRPKAP